MFEEGKCYAQFCYGKDFECVFLEKIKNITNDGLGLFGITIQEDGFTYEDAFYAGGFEEDIEEKYIEIPINIFNVLKKISLDESLNENETLAKEWIAKFKEICKGSWRNLDEE